MKRLAVFFDFDGVIADSEPLHYQAFQRVLEPMGAGFSWIDYQSEYIGYDDRDVLRLALGRAGYTMIEQQLPRWVSEKAVAFEQLVRESPPPLYPGVRRLLEALRPEAIIALCTGAMPSDLRAILNGSALMGCFDVMITAVDVRAGKPDPEGYRLARNRVAQLVYPSMLSGVAIEDTPAGIRAAHGAGLPVLAVTTTHPPEALRDADRIVQSVAEILVADLQQIAR